MILAHNWPKTAKSSWQCPFKPSLIVSAFSAWHVLCLMILSAYVAVSVSSPSCLPIAWLHDIFQSLSLRVSSSVSLTNWLTNWLSTFLIVCLFTLYLPDCLCLPVCKPFCLSVFLSGSVSLTNWLTDCLLFWLFACLHCIYLIVSVCLSVSLSVCLFFWVFFWLYLYLTAWLSLPHPSPTRQPSNNRHQRMV